MKTLYFVKQRDREWSTIVHLLTADSEEHAKQLSTERIADFCRHEYQVTEVTALCTTPDDVDFEPV